MDQELDKAIKIVEDRGGFVMLPECESEERDIRKVTHQLNEEKLKELEREEAENLSDIEKRKKTAFHDMNEVFTEPLFMAKGIISQMNDLEDILLENGLESDYLEDWIESQI